jgi:4'-phosphopantetheinyl transferase
MGEKQRSLADGEVQVWSIPLAVDPERRRRLAGLLATDETARAERFRFDVHRHRYIAGRGALREVLGAYLERPPQNLRFAYGPRGKPWLPEHRALHFNLSHSEDQALLGVTTVAELGVDIERIRPLSDLEAVARRFFAEGEVERLFALPPAQWPDAFFRCWTRKEAYLKAVGEGLAIPLDRFEVTLTAHEPVRFLAFRDPAERVEDWSLYHLEPVAGYMAAVALRARPSEVRWSPL